MRKFEVDFIRQEANNISRCVLGDISTKYNAKVDELSLEKAEIFKQTVVNGLAKVDPKELLAVIEKAETSYMKSGKLKTNLRELIKVDSDRIKEIDAEIKVLTDRKKELSNTVELKKKEAVSNAILGVTKKEEIITSLESLKDLSANY